MKIKIIMNQKRRKISTSCFELLLINLFYEKKNYEFNEGRHKFRVYAFFLNHDYIALI
jgi:hypothetical protein